MQHTTQDDVQLKCPIFLHAWLEAPKLTGKVTDSGMWVMDKDFCIILHYFAFTYLETYFLSIQ